MLMKQETKKKSAGLSSVYLELIIKYYRFPKSKSVFLNMPVCLKIVIICSAG